MFFGLTFEKIAILAVIAALVIGPERLPEVSQSLVQLIRRAKVTLSATKDRMRNEMGNDFDDVDWKKLDPRQYDPRRIIREALLEPPPIAHSMTAPDRTSGPVHDAQSPGAATPQPAET